MVDLMKNSYRAVFLWLAGIANFISAIKTRNNCENIFIWRTFINTNINNNKFISYYIVVLIICL